MQHIGSHIAALRKTRNLSQKRLAELSKISASYISDIEGGRRNPTTSMLTGIAKAFGMSLSELFATSRYELTGIEADLLGHLRAQEWDKARAIIDTLAGV